MLAAIFPECVGKLPQSEVADVMRQLKTGGYDSFVRIDVKDFYPSVDHNVLIGELATRIRKKEILRIIRAAIATPTVPDRAPRPRALLTHGIPQGLSISNPLAEIYMRPVDRAMSGHGTVSYHRFVDDILILCPASETESADKACRAALASIGLSAHPGSPGGKSEIGTLSKGFTYLGYRFDSKHISVRQSSVVRLESHLASIHAGLRHDLDRGMPVAVATHRFLWHRNLAITGCIFQGVASGWIQYFRQLDDLTLLKRLDATVSRLGVRYSAPPSPAPKTFMKAYWAIRHPRSRSTSYVPNFDRYDVVQMRAELTAMGSDTTTRSDHEIKDAFYRMVSKAVRDLERDVGDVS